MYASSREISQELAGGLLGIRLSLQVPPCLRPIYGNLYKSLAVSHRLVRLRARAKGGGHWTIDYGPHRKLGAVCGNAALYYAVDKALVLELQRQCSELLFFHAAVLGSSRSVIAVLATSGGGKSTTSLAAIKAGLECFSDELAPIELDTLRVWPYPRALSLKSKPTLRYAHGLPHVHRIDQQWFVPLKPRLSPSHGSPIPLRALVILEQVSNDCSHATRLSGAQALAHVYSHCLNPLAHDNGGLSAVKRLLGALPCYRFSSASPTDTVAFLASL